MVQSLGPRDYLNGISLSLFLLMCFFGALI